MKGSKGDSRPEALREQLSTGFAELGDLLRSGLTDLSDRDGPAREELRQAWSDFAAASQRLALALATTVRDPELRAGARQALGSIVDAVGTAARNAAGRARPERPEGEQAQEAEDGATAVEAAPADDDAADDDRAGDDSADDDPADQNPQNEDPSKEDPPKGDPAPADSAG